MNLRVLGRWSAIVCLSFILAFVASACKTKSDGKNVIRVASWGDVAEIAIQQESMKEFERLHPGVKIEFIHIPFNDYVTKISTQFASNMAPDVMAINAEQLPAFADRGIFQDLMPYLANDKTVKLKDLYPEALDRYTVDGKLLGLPRDIAPICVIFYNKDAFKEAGLKPPSKDWGMAEFLKDAQALMKRDADGKVKRWGFVDDWPIWEAWVLNHGGKLVDDVKRPTRCMLDQPEAIAGLQARADMMHKYKVMPAPSSMSAMGGMGTSDMFMNGTVGLFHGGIWKVPQFRKITAFDWDVAPFPRGPKGKAGFPMSAAGYGITKNAKDPQLCYEVIQFLSGEKGQIDMAKTGLAQPAMRKVAASPAFLDDQKPASKKFLLDSIQYGVYKPFDVHTDEWYFSLVGPKLDRVWNGNETAATAMPVAVAEVNKKFYSKKK